MLELACWISRLLVLQPEVFVFVCCRAAWGWLRGEPAPVIYLSNLCLVRAWCVRTVLPSPRQSMLFLPASPMFLRNARYARNSPGAAGINAAIRKAERNVPNMAGQRRKFLSRLFVVVVCIHVHSYKALKSYFVGHSITSAST